MNIVISTDSTADIPAKYREEYGIRVLPLSIISGNQEWLDGVTITPEEFYPILEAADKLPTSAAVPPVLYTQLFEEVWQAGCTELIHVSLNSKGSSTYQNGCLARVQFYEAHPEAESTFRIHIIDSLTYSMGYGMAVIDAAKMAAAGAAPEEIIAGIHDWLDHVRPTFVPLDLKCVKRSGRISAAAAFVGDAIGLKPIIRFEEGEARIITKVRGEKNAFKEILSIAASEIRPGSTFALVCSNNQEANARFVQAVEEALPGHTVIAYQVGCIISINTGPNMVGIIYAKQ